MTEPNQNLTDAQRAALDAGTHVLDPVFGFQPVLPVTEGGTVAQDAPGANESFDDEIAREQQAIQEAQQAADVIAQDPAVQQDPAVAQDTFQEPPAAQ